MNVEMNEPVVMVSGYSRSAPTRGAVVKIGRVWIEVQPEGWTTGRTLRFRLDNQTDGSQYPSSQRFYTLGQWAENQRQVAASEFLSDQGIRVEHGSLWRGREVELANLLRTASKPAEEQ
jgi:hypothetical protein